MGFWKQLFAPLLKGERADAPMAADERPVRASSSAAPAAMASSSAAIIVAAQRLAAAGSLAEALALIDRARADAPDDASIVELQNGASDFIAQARTRQWKRESFVRMLA